MSAVPVDITEQAVRFFQRHVIPIQLTFSNGSHTYRSLISPEGLSNIEGMSGGAIFAWYVDGGDGSATGCTPCKARGTGRLAQLPLARLAHLARC